MEPALLDMKYYLKKVSSSNAIPQLMGYEGSAAHVYFQTLGKLIVPEFHFNRRSKRPPLDAFNSMISLGYSILMNELYGKIEGKGLNPYFGIMHSDHEKHPTLASDLMEEWRAVISDSIAMSLANGREIMTDDFYTDDNGGVFLKPDGFKKFIRKIENKFASVNRYFEDEGEISFRRALDLQVNSLCHALEEKKPELYHPVIIR